MLQIMFGQSKYYSDALSENVKRGNRTKIEKGWRPNMAPLGYLNDTATKTVVKDPVHFPLIRKMFEMMLTGAYTPKQIALTSARRMGIPHAEEEADRRLPARHEFYLQDPQQSLLCWHHPVEWRELSREARTYYHPPRI